MERTRQLEIVQGLLTRHRAVGLLGARQVGKTTLAHQLASRRAGRTSAPRSTLGLRSALADLRLTSLDVVHAGSATFPLSTQMRAVAAQRVLADIEPLS